MSLSTDNGYLLADNVLVEAGQSWYSEHSQLDRKCSGVGFEVSLTGSGTGSFVPRAGATRRYNGASFVGTTDTTTTGGTHLPAVDGIESTDLPDVTEAPKEWFINIGNLNANFCELEFKCLTGYFRLTVRACQKAA